MAKTMLDSAMAAISAQWGPLTTERVAAARVQMKALAAASPD